MVAESSNEPTKRRKLVGYKNFVRSNPKSDLFPVERFHHIEFWCGDATNTQGRFAIGLGMTQCAKSDMSTGNKAYASYVLKSNDLLFAFTAPYLESVDNNVSGQPHPGFNQTEAHEFHKKHGLAVRAVGLLCEDATEAFLKATSNGAIPVLEPKVLHHKGDRAEKQMISEVKLYGDVVLRFISNHGHKGAFLADYDDVPAPPNGGLCYGLQRLDHAVGNVHNLIEAVDHICGFTGFHQFAEFTAEDVGTIDSGLNSMVLANNNEMVLLPVNEPTFGTKRKSQIQTYLEQNGGPGLQHLALKTENIYSTVRQMKQFTGCGGFEFQAPASEDYYKKLPLKIGDALTAEEYRAVEELGLLVDKDDQGVLVQVFTKPLGDRPTIFIEVIQRIGCMSEQPGVGQVQAAGCGGFGKGNFSELFKSIENYERTLKV